MRGGRAAFLLVLVAGMLSAPAAGASAAGWLPAVDTSPVATNATNMDLSLQDVAVDDQGNAVAVWVQSAGGPEIVEAATRPAGGSWSGPVDVSSLGEDALGLKVAVNPDGDAAVVWMGLTSAGGVVIRAAGRPVGGDWSEPAALSGLDGYAIEPDLAIDGEGAVTATWSEGEGSGEYGVVEAATRPADGDWGEPVELSDGSAISPQLAVDPEGEVTAVWTLLGAGRDDGIIQSKTRPAEGEWSSDPVDVSAAAGLASYPRIAIDAQGDATAVWLRQDIPAASGFRRFVQTAGREDGAWSAPLAISREDWISGAPEVTVDPQGSATAIWVGGQPGTATRYLQARGRTADGSWDDPVNLVTKSGLSEPQESDLQLAADPQGDVTAIWTAWAGSTFVVRSARRAVGSAWSTPADVSAAGGYSLWPRMAIDPQGYATVVWSGFQGKTQAVRSRVFDPVGPELRALTVPASGVVGQALGMSVDPFDLWSSVATKWDFGDGSLGTGAAVTHCFGSPGERTVTATGVDLAGNATSAARTITIAADPALASSSDPCSGPGPDPGPGPTPRPGPGSGPGTAPARSGRRSCPPCGSPTHAGARGLPSAGRGLRSARPSSSSWTARRTYGLCSPSSFPAAGRRSAASSRPRQTATSRAAAAARAGAR